MLGAFGLEVNNKDWDVGRILKGDPISETEVLRDEKGNLQRDANGNVITRIMRDLEGNIVSSGGKYTDEYNCDDFKTQPAAQKFLKPPAVPVLTPIVLMVTRTVLPANICLKNKFQLPLSKNETFNFVYRFWSAFKW